MSQDSEPAAADETQAMPAQEQAAEAQSREDGAVEDRALVDQAPEDQGLEDQAPRDQAPEHEAPVRETDLAAAARVLDEPGGLPSALEAILMVADTPVATAQLATVLARPEAEVRDALTELAADYQTQHRGFVLREQGGGWRYYSSPTFAPVVDAFVLDGQTARLTQASLETLAVIAYRQPVSRGRVAAIRGVNVDSVVRTLLSRGLIEEAGQDPDGGANLYRTSTYFLERLGLRSLDELPPLAPYLPDLDELVDLEDGVDLDGGARA